MNKFHLLMALSLSAKAYESGELFGGDYADGWYAGDCLDPATFGAAFGYVDYNCGDMCMSNY